MRLWTIAAILLTGLAGGAAAAEDPPRQLIDGSLAIYASGHDSVSLPDGRVIHFTCIGSGSPTVILTAGLGDWGASWSAVQSTIGRTTRVCAWDRPGFGLSDAGANAQSSASTTADLEAALARGSIPGPYILVGHSLGSYESLLYADRHPENVVGMVLVDPSIPNQFTMMRQVAPLIAATNDAYVKQVVALVQGCAAQVRGTIKPLKGSPPLDCEIAYLPIYPPVVINALKAKAFRPGQPEAVVSFFENVGLSSEQVVNPARNYGSMPLIVLSATAQQEAPPGTSPEALAQFPVYEAAFARGHEELAALSARGINARVPEASHYIQSTKPQVVIDAVEAVIAEARVAKN